MRYRLSPVCHEKRFVPSSVQCLLSMDDNSVWITVIYSSQNFDKSASITGLQTNIIMQVLSPVRHGFFLSFSIFRCTLM